MRPLRAFGLIAALTFVALASSASARAALVHEFVDTSTNSVVGSIEFSDVTPGMVLAFSFFGFNGSPIGLSSLCTSANPCNSLSETTDWSIDPDDWSLNDFLLVFGSFTSGGLLLEVSIDFANPASTGVSGTQSDALNGLCGGDPFCAASVDSQVQTLYGNIATRPVEVSEPPTLLTFLLGLGLLAAVARWRSREHFDRSCGRLVLRPAV